MGRERKRGNGIYESEGVGRRRGGNRSRGRYFKVEIKPGVWREGEGRGRKEGGGIGGMEHGRIYRMG